MKTKEKKNFVTKTTDQLMFGWTLMPISMSHKRSLKYYEKFATEIKGVSLTSN